jgi:hypothetical protein
MFLKIKSKYIHICNHSIVHQEHCLPLPLGSLGLYGQSRSEEYPIRPMFFLHSECSVGEQGKPLREWRERERKSFIGEMSCIVL